jgi:hypothetical protein
MAMPHRISFERLLLIAEAVLGIPYKELEDSVCILRAEASLAAPFARIGGVFLHRDPVERAGICAIRLVRSQLFPEYNGKVAFVCMREMLLRSGYLWLRPDEESDDPPEAFRQLEDREMSDAAFLRWVREWAKPGTGLEDPPTA